MNSPYWFEVAVVFGLTTVGNILMARWAEGVPKWRRIAKAIFFAGLSVLISATAGRGWFFVFLGVMLALVTLIHVWWLPKKGINGWTAEPRERYYALRGWKWPPERGND
jgi:hypothetical protein